MSDAAKVRAKAGEALAGADEKLRSAFIEFDTDGSGSLSASEIEVGVTKTGADLTRQEITTLVRSFDKGDGKVSIAEFFQAFGKSYKE